jgi:hypothetical protein
MHGRPLSPVVEKRLRQLGLGDTLVSSPAALREPEPAPPLVPPLAEPAHRARREAAERELRGAEAEAAAASARVNVNRLSEEAWQLYLAKARLGAVTWSVRSGE